MAPSNFFSMHQYTGGLVGLNAATRISLWKNTQILLRRKSCKIMTRQMTSDSNGIQHDIERIDQFMTNIDKLNPRINAFISYRNTDLVKKDLSRAQDGPLKGQIIALKDNYCTTDQKTTCGSKILENFVSPYDATVVKLIQKAGGTVIGKTNMDEFAMGSNNDQSAFGITCNPLFSEDTSTGGSSGGSAAAVAADMCDIALGTDTGGSVRLPSAYCGVIGFKPSYGLISRYGVISYAQSLDTVGILAKKVSSVQNMFNVLNKYDKNDPTCISEATRTKIAALTSKSKKSLRIGIISEAIINLSQEVREEWINCLDYVRSLGHEVEVVSIPALKQALPVYFILSPAEASSNLARYDGIRYGTRVDVDRYVSETGETFESTLYGPTRTKGFGDEVQRRILLGTYNLNAGAYSNHFSKAQKVRRKLIEQFNDVFTTKNIFDQDIQHKNSKPNNASLNSSKVDCIILPTARTTAPTHEQIRNESDPIESYVNDVLTVPANLAGLPAISVPWGKKSVGMQIWAQFGDDQLVLEVANILERGITQSH